MPLKSQVKLQPSPPTPNVLYIAWHLQLIVVIVQQFKAGQYSTILGKKICGICTFSGLIMYNLWVASRSKTGKW